MSSDDVVSFHRPIQPSPGRAHRLGARGRAHLGEDLPDVELRGVRRDAQHAGDVAVRQPLAQQLEHLDFARRQRLVSGARSPTASRAPTGPRARRRARRAARGARAGRKLRPRRRRRAPIVVVAQHPRVGVVVGAPTRTVQRGVAQRRATPSASTARADDDDARHRLQPQRGAAARRPRAPARGRRRRAPRELDLRAHLGARAGRPGCPRWPPTLTITSPTRRPARAAGPPSATELTSRPSTPRRRASRAPAARDAKVALLHVAVRGAASRTRSTVAAGSTTP